MRWWPRKGRIAFRSQVKLVVSCKSYIIVHISTAYTNKSNGEHCRWFKIFIQVQFCVLHNHDGVGYASVFCDYDVGCWISYCSTAADLNIDDNDSLRRSLEELLKLLLMVWCKENQANKLISSKPNGNVYVCIQNNYFFVE